jgi:hypothetical protein
MPSVDPTRTPDQELADIIVDKLVAAGLVSQAKSTELRKMLAAGTVTIEDWKRYVEQAEECVMEVAHVTEN